MFLNKVKEKLKDVIKDAKAFDDCVSNYGKDDDYDVDVKTARYNYEMYQNDLNQRSQDLIKQWCKEIKEASSRGEKFIFTNKFITDDDKNKILHLLNRADCVCDFPQDSYLEYFQRYFEERGFKVVRIEYQNNNICCLKIIWIPSNDT